MPKCDFDIAFNGNADEIVRKAAAAINNAGGTLKGDNSSGDFELPTPLGSVRGNYILKEGFIGIQIHSKPLLLGCSRIEEELRNYLSK